MKILVKKPEQQTLNLSGTYYISVNDLESCLKEADIDDGYKIRESICKNCMYYEEAMVYSGGNHVECNACVFWEGVKAARQYLLEQIGE